jgi:hypothetical protein
LFVFERSSFNGDVNNHAQAIYNCKRTCGVQEIDVNDEDGKRVEQAVKTQLEHINIWTSNHN